MALSSKRYVAISLQTLIYSMVSEVGALAYFKFKLRKIVFVDFHSCFQCSN